MQNESLLIDDPEFGTIADFDYIRDNIQPVYDYAYPNYNMLAAAHLSAEVAGNDPDVFVSIGASALAYSIIIAAEEYEIATSIKDKIYSLAWTEEHCGSDLLSVRTYGTPIEDDPTGKQYHIKGSKWLINCSFHADYHVVVGKVDPERSDPRALSFFLVPRSSCKNWERLETHALDRMVLTKFEIDGPGTLLGKVGHGLTILQRMAMPSKYQATYIGIILQRLAYPAAIEHLATKHIFGTNPIQFSNVFRQMYNLIIKAACYEFLFYRAVVFNTDGFLQFHGTMLKSYLLLRMNEGLSQNLLVTGSKGFLKENAVGKSAYDSFILPVFDGHYTINTLMTSKHIERYLSSTERVDLEDRLERLRAEIFQETEHDEINARARDIRKPPFFDYADYVQQFNLPFDLPAETMIGRVSDLMQEIADRGLTSDPEYRYKTGDLLHWMESVLGACELWRLSGEENYLNAIVLQYNGLVDAINAVISEGGFATEFLVPLRQVPIARNGADHAEFLRRLFDVRAVVKEALAEV